VLGIFGEPIVLFRDGSGNPAALHDRCPHRGVALSLGSVEGGSIACAYHGWRFGGDGRCAHVPSLTADRSIPPGAAVRTYPCAEQDGQIWIWMGDGEPAGTPRPIPGFADTIWVQGAIDLACEAILPIENNLDICHPTFTHAGSHPQWFMVQQVGFNDREYLMTSTGTGITVEAGPTTLRYDLPDRVTVVTEGPVPFRLILMHTPTAPGRCRQHWLMASGSVGDQRPHAVSWSDDEPEILAQDRRVMESAQRAYEAEGDGFEVSVEADACCA
jgi:nitrite reductase/ring-hydroxylating ferredoxin subunit